MRAFAFVGDFRDVCGVLASGAFDRIFNIVARKVLRFRVVDRDAEWRVGFRVRTTVFRGHRDGFGQFRENFGHGCPS